MDRSQDIVIKTSPVVFLSWLIAIELVGGLFGFVLALLIDLPDVYTDLQLTRYASFNFMLGLVLTLVQVSVISQASSIPLVLASPRQAAAPEGDGVPPISSQHSGSTSTHPPPGRQHAMVLTEQLVPTPCGVPP